MALKVWPSDQQYHLHHHLGITHADKLLILKCKYSVRLPG